MPSIELDRLPDPFSVAPLSGALDATVRVPGSKSVTNRALVCAALASGTSTLNGALFADDTEAMLGVLDALGIDVVTDEVGERITVVGCAGVVPPSSAPVDVRQSGTTARFALPLLALGSGSYRVTAHPQMQGRPMAPTLDAIEALGAGVEPLVGVGSLPVSLSAGRARSALLQVPGDVSSQFLSGLLLIGPCLPGGLPLVLTTDLVSRPYVDLTIGVMQAFGAVVEQDGPDTFNVSPGGYRGLDYDVEPDASAASYPWAAAAICGGRVRVEGLGQDALQGDMAFLEVLAAMGATVSSDASGTTVAAEAGALRGGTFDLTDFSDTAPTLAVVA